jgi:hypothetical protein
LVNLFRSANGQYLQGVLAGGSEWFLGMGKSEPQKINLTKNLPGEKGDEREMKAG